MSVAPILELDGIAKTYRVRQGMFAPKLPLRAVDGVTLRLARGETLGLVGESGCGKSTLAKILLGLEAPTAGRIRVDGVTVAGSGWRKELSRRIQPIFQDPYSSLNPRKTVRQIVAMPLDVHGIAAKPERDRMVDEILDVVGLPRRAADSTPSQMSGGQRQRVAIARALVMRPEVVICDEPTSALDVSVQAQILNLLLELRREFGLTYLFISHNLAVVEHLADRVAVMYLGRIVEERPAAALFAGPRHPYTRALLDSVLTPEPGLGIPDTQLGAAFPNPIVPPPGCAFHPRCPRAGEICRAAAPPFDAASGAACHFPLERSAR
ncbi:dipeptide transporter; ATP-binding component of ABC superfamily [uncultured Alphaproteobacteria bacterium]|uniref:Dipeptide transporter ATP-binding component of ABC superfamily n=1 Tax=uncultured Alphaproteobacteria bacterium TaxID=91750 RepID=A0A212K416_9PROT|nr:dipeptide transporter; ATP-binding component of ABC superfamily [uncultured Alphaproteobacteria bacterium]